MKRTLFVLFCVMFITQFASAQYYPYPGHIPTAQEFVNAGKKAVMNSGKKSGTPSNSSTTPTRKSTQNRSSVKSENNTSTCPVCGGNGKCTSMTHPTAPNYCHGSGSCKSCSGKGYVTSTYTGINSTMKCTYCWIEKVGKCGTCRGTGKCRSCNGTGKLR